MVNGGVGGHSGIDIDRGHANAIKVLGRVLREALVLAPFRLVSLHGGHSWNAIPREADAMCSVPSEQEDPFRRAVAAAAATVRDAYRTTDSRVDVAVGDAADAAEAWTVEGTRALLDLLPVVPSGPLATSQDFPGLVETSTSVGEASSEAERFELHSLTRSSNASALPEVIAALDAAARLTGGRLEVGQADPGWQPNLDSAALAAARHVYERLFASTPRISAVHAWLETAVIGEKVPGLDMVAFGPQIEAPHSPDERVSIPSVDRFWHLLTALINELSAAR